MLVRRRKTGSCLEYRVCVNKTDICDLRISDLFFNVEKEITHDPHVLITMIEHKRALKQYQSAHDLINSLTTV